MSFATTYLADPVKVGAGELIGDSHIVLGATTFEDGLKIGYFAKLDAGSIDNLDGSSTPVIAGVVLRNAANAVEDGSTFDTTNTNQIAYARKGIVTVEVVSGDTPAKFGAVYAVNASGSGANFGKATTTSTNNVLVTGAVFLEEIKAGVWSVLL